MKDSPVESIVATIVCVTLAFMAWQWQQAIRRRQPPLVVAEHWEHVKELFPTPEALESPSATDPETLQRVVQVNPFSRQRRHVSKPAEETAAEEKPLPVSFVFKGRVVMGAKQRGILEDRRQKKTVFVQAGQEVSGFQVVDIKEEEMVLLNLETKEELHVPLASKASSKE
ncbi:MAG: hypothetical protein HY595_02690 [Candidatus Omnitrophica bacterium]|nr:hypothetical protein [Candidatus Omnitrophota bacterium]